jgi:hypothetical protein
VRIEEKQNQPSTEKVSNFKAVASRENPKTEIRKPKEIRNTESTTLIGYN